MGIIEFLKGLFKKEEEIITEDVSIEDTLKWLDLRYDEFSKVIEQDLLEIRQKISEQREKLKENVDNFEKAQLPNPDLPGKVKSTMEGNKTAYIQKVEGLMEDFNMPENPVEILGFCDLFDNKLDDFAKNSVKNYQISIEFFGQAKYIAENIRDISELMKKAKKTIINSNIHLIASLKEKIKEGLSKIEQKSRLAEKVENEKKELEKENSWIDEKEKKLKEIENSEDYKKFKDLINERETLRKSTSETESSISSSFSDISSALKKYERVSLESSLINSYLEDPVTGILSDVDLKIIKILSDMKERIIKGDIDLKDSKKEKILREIETITKERILNFIEEYERLSKKIEKFDLDIEQSPVAKEIEALRDSLGSDKIKFERDEKEYNKLTADLEKIDIDALKKDLESEINKCFSKHIHII